MLNNGAAMRPTASGRVITGLIICSQFNKQTELDLGMKWINSKLKKNGGKER